MCSRNIPLVAVVAAMLVAPLTAALSEASEASVRQGDDVVVRFVAPNEGVYAEGATFTVDLIGDLSMSILGWGLDLTIEPAGVVSLTRVEVGAAFEGAHAADDDNLAGLGFPSPVVGDGVVLALLEFEAVQTGDATVDVKVTSMDKAEGFAEEPSGFSDFSTVPLNVRVLEPGAAPGDTLRPRWLPLTVDPNPFTTGVDLTFSLATPGPISLTIYDVSGRAVRRLSDSGQFPAGLSWLHWNGKDDDGHPVGNGIYFSVLETGGRRHVARLGRIR
jgi:hypothetical protein